MTARLTLGLVALGFVFYGTWQFSHGAAFLAVGGLLLLELLTDVKPPRQEG